MRGLWDHEQPLSPASLQAGVGLFTWMMAALAVLNVLGALGVLFQGRWLTAMVWMLSGTAIPFAIWLVVRMLADMLIQLNRTAEQMTELTRDLVRPPHAAPGPYANAQPDTPPGRDSGA